MTALVVDGVTGLPDDAMPWRRLSSVSSGTTFRLDSTSTDRQLMLLGADLTATQANPVQCFASLQLGGVTFYWDSQSTGEGNGITFAWRGQLPIAVGETLSWIASASASITFGAVLWGYVCARQHVFT